MTCNNTKRCMLCQIFSIDKTLLNSIFTIIVLAGKYTLKPINRAVLGHGFKHLHSSKKGTGMGLLVSI